MNRSSENAMHYLPWYERDWLDRIILVNRKGKREWQQLPLPFVNRYSQPAEAELFHIIRYTNTVEMSISAWTITKYGNSDGRNLRTNPVKRAKGRNIPNRQSR
jgi:hypothetical protein